jgi:3-oxoacyl-(acyl-carrier-protein) synthase
MSAALDDAGLTAADVDAVFASANGTKRLDAVEAHAIARLFACDVVASKAYFGEHAAGNALQIAAAILAVADQILPASAGFEVRDESLPLVPTRTAVARPLRHVLVNAISAGGGIVSAVISREAA